MIRITDTIELDERDIKESFMRSSGPGGQNVNKVSTAVELRYDITKADLPYDLKIRLRTLAGRQLTREGILIIQSQEHRSQERNRETALTKFISILRRAAIKPRRRIATRPTRASTVRRLDSKTKRSRTKQLRGAGPEFD